MSMPMSLSDTVGQLQRLNIRHDGRRPHINILNYAGIGEGDADADSEPNTQVLEDAIPHLFLPKETPGAEQPNLVDVEDFLLQSFHKSITEAVSEVPFPQLKSTQLMFEKWVEIQPIDYDDCKPIQNFQREIATLKKGQTIPIYVRKQNSTLLITRQGHDDTIKIATFRSSLPSEMVMSTVGSLSLTFPETQEVIQDKEMLESHAFAMNLHELAVGEVDISKERTTKGGHECKQTREVTDPRFVSDWIIGLLVPASTSKSTADKECKIEKKIRDQVNLLDFTGSSKSLPFRRSGMYMSLKVGLQLKLLEALGSLPEAKLVYKILLLRILVDVTEQILSWNQVNMDLASQLLAKLGRRAFKLEAMDTPTSTSQEIQEIITTWKTNCLERTQATVERFSDQMHSAWKKISEPANDVSGVLIKFQEKVAPIYHYLPEVDNFIKTVKTVTTSHYANTPREDVISSADSHAIARFPTINYIESSPASASSATTWLYDTEQFLKHQCDDLRIGANRISKLVIKYVDRARSYQENNPLAMSQLYLVTLKGMELLDKIATTECPLLLDYKPSINFEIFDNLLLPYQKDMELLDQLLYYFRTRERRAPYPGVLDSAVVKKTTFSVRYAAQDQNMKALKARILQDVEQEVENKHTEVSHALTVCRSLQHQIAKEVTCQCEFKTYQQKNKKGIMVPVTQKTKQCQKCNYQKTLRKKRKSVAAYEKPLPPQENYQNAVVFEYLIPPNFAIWRDFLAYFKWQVLGDPQTGIKQGTSSNWLDYQKLSGYKGGKGKKKKSPPNIRLGSTVMSTSATYHTKTQSLDVLTNKVEDFVVENAMNTTFYKADQSKFPIDVSIACCFKLNKTSNGTWYSNLQNTIESTNHTQNNILARQSECHQRLALHEFVAFGSLRAGHRIQLRNLYAAMFSGTLSLEQEPVLALVLQTIWQVGPTSTDFKRESHFDFEDPAFAQEFIDMLDKIVKTNEANYSNSLILLTAVIITRRIADLNGSLQQNCYKVLKSWRAIMTTWTNKINGVLDQPETAGVYGGIGSMRENLLQIVLCSLFSYSVADDSNLASVMKDEADVVHWLETLYQLHQIEEQPVATSELLKTLLTLAKIIPLRLDIESKIREENELYVKSLKTFIGDRWTKAKDKSCVLKTLEFPLNFKNEKHVLLAEYLEEDGETGEKIRHHVTFDFFMGTVLVNGFSQSSLPVQIRDDKLFLQYFKDWTNLRVYQDTSRVTRTVTTYHGRHYEFYHEKDETAAYRDPFDDDFDSVSVIIREIQKDSSKLVLLNPDKFSGALSNHFLSDYTHWLDTTNNIVYFRPIDGDSQDHYQLQKAVGVGVSSFWKLTDLRSRECVLSITTQTFRDVTRVLERLEMSRYIDVTLNEKTVITAHLRRYNLRFTVKSEDTTLRSVEYPGYCTSANQTNKGTLVGLYHGLLLKNKEKRLLLVPHSSISTVQGQDGHHQSVFISLENLRQPASFLYEFDDALKRLKAHNSKSAWLYLAALHAVTSSPVPDPFTEITGTEMAVRILQSACVWSCSPYDSESATTLKYIRGLSPKRKYYGHVAPRRNRCEDKGTMEITNWPLGLRSMAAYDGFAIIAEKLLSESEKLSMLHAKTSDKETTEKEKPSERLRMRAYLRYLTMYNSAVAVEKPNYFSESQITLVDNCGASIYNLPLRKSSADMNLPNLQSTAFTRLTKTLQPFIQSGVFKKSNLTGFLLTPEELQAPSPPISLTGYKSFDDLLSLDVRANWLKLYMLATECSYSEEDINQFTVILSAMAYRGVPLEQIANLHCIALFKDQVSFPNAVSTLGTTPEVSYGFYPNPTDNDYMISTVENILSSNAKPFAMPVPTIPFPISRRYGTSGGQRPETDEEWKGRLEEYKLDRKKYVDAAKEYAVQKKAYENKIKESCWILSRLFQKEPYWPCERISAEATRQLLESRNINHQPAIHTINCCLASWYQNYKLKLFLDEVQLKLNGIFEDFQAKKIVEAPASVEVGRLIGCSSQVWATCRNEIKVEIEELLVTEMTRKWESEAVAIFQTGVYSHGGIKGKSYGKKREKCEERIQSLVDEILDMVTSDKVSKKIVQLVGLSPRLDPISILKYLLKNVNSDKPLSPGRKTITAYCGALGVLWTHLKRLNRCIRASNDVDLQREKDNPGHQNWSPRDHPEWLLLELELDIMIRPVQVDVAKQMITMPDGRNGVTQLNMGEGKTSVIVPMLCCTLAKSNSQLCRVTVLSSMFKMNLNSLTFSIGGLLNRRVYSVPCRRDMKIDDLGVTQIGQVYRECLQMQGVVLTLPEYRLSFRLLAYDNIFKKNGILGQKMLGVENFLRQYARDVLDESDELFSVKYQLVYTIGEQVPVDGGDLRWTMCQRILKTVQKMGNKMLSKFGTSMVEFDTEAYTRSPHEFSMFRLLNTACVNDFLGEIADEVLDGVLISENEKRIVKEFLVQNEVSMASHLQVVNTVFQDAPDLLSKILLMSGYLRRGILSLALVKRWRVEYGVNPKQGFRRMAVPFRAKDVAAEKTEFGHPDLAIILTHLSYYYSGLDDNQLTEVFEILREKQAPNAIYSSWIAEIPDTGIPDFLRKYYSLNMKDAYQKSKLFEMLRRHKMVVDFWLSHCVFPRESKQFPGKLVMTAWDLCYERQQFPVTGFSGTNDSKILLPLMISQQDLPQLLTTNAEMEKTLLRPENKDHKGFPMGVTCKQILETMKQDKLTVLIDAGALMLECSNEQVADLWLSVDPNIEAVIYFSKDNELLVKSRGDHGKGTAFEVSPYQGRLDKCGVFLDDQHTRGTDLKFPLGSRACVTIATRMKRDKLIQACMRMRKLGQGHSVTFYLSHEATDKIQQQRQSGISTQAVLEWVSKNTKDSNEDGLLYWALAGRNYAQRLAAEDTFHFPQDVTPYRAQVENASLTSKAEILAKQCVDEEVVKLIKMYGQYMNTELLHKLIVDWFAFTKARLVETNNGQELQPQIKERFFQICAEIKKKIAHHAPTKIHQMSSGSTGITEEEQEKELELEKEVEAEDEREVERPRKADEAAHNLHPYVKSVVANGTIISVVSGAGSILRLCDVFKGTSFWNEVQPPYWAECGVFATNDFVSVIKEYDSAAYYKTDSYLRPIQYLISRWDPSASSIQLLLLSPYEVNELMPYFRSGQAKCRLHMFALRRAEKQDVLLNNVKLQLPLTAGPSFKIDEGSCALASLLLASGNLYFNSKKEQTAFVQFLGLVPQPWSSEESAAFEKGMITKSGFLLPKYRNLLSLGRRQGFKKDPTILVKKILLCRHPVVSEVTHVLRLLEDKRYI